MQLCDQPQSTESDAGLIRRLQGGDIAAFDVLFDRHRRRLLAYVTGLTGDVALAEDIVQESFVSLAQRVGGLDPERGAAPWLFRVARNRAIDMIRHRRFETPRDALPASPSTEGARPDGPDSPAEHVVSREREAGVRQALDRLPARDRELLLLRFYGDLTFKEMARVLRRPLGTVLWQGRRSLEKLRRELEKSDVV